MRITVLGKSPAWADAGGACSGYLIQTGEYTVLLDCGGGVIGKLREQVDYTEVDSVVISHIHGDHVLDLIPYAYALLHSPRQQSRPVDSWPGTGSPARPQLWLPPGGIARMAQITGAWDDPDLLAKAFDLAEYSPQKGLGLGPLELRFCEVPHFTLTYAIEFREGQGSTGRFTFGADCRSSQALTDFAAESDLLFLEATLDRPETGPRRGHMSAGEAGALAGAARAKRTVLTHISDELDPTRTLAEARAAYPGGAIELAAGGAQYEVS